MTGELTDGPDGTFDPAEVAGLPEPVRRFFAAALEPGTQRWRSAELQMRGSIRIGRWIGFRASETLTPRRGFVWRARAAGVISGSDRYLDGLGAMRWKLLGVVPVMQAEGPDISRSAAGRAGGEALWLPTTLLPHFGTHWEAVDDHHVVARFSVDDTLLALGLTIDGQGFVTEVVYDRWGDPDSSGTFGWHPFGGTMHARDTFAGMTIPVAGSFGWGFGSERWPDGEFFRYRLTAVKPVSAEDTVSDDHGHGP